MSKENTKIASRQRVGRHSVSLALACGLTLALGSGIARADTGLGFSNELGSAGVGAGQFTSPAGVAVDQSSGDLYVVDSANARVEKFGLLGEFVLTFGWEVNETTKGNVCTEAEITGSGVKCQAGLADKEPAEAKPGEFGVKEFFGTHFGPAGIAVDPTAPHDVYVTDSVNNRVQEFDSAGNYLGQVNGSEPSCPGPFSNPSGVAVDPSSAELYVADSGNDHIVKINPVTGVCDEAFDNEIASTGGFASVSGIALDAAGNVYVVAGERVDKFNAAGKLQATEALDAGGNPASVAVNPATNDVYVGDASGSRYHFLQYGPTGTLLDQFGDTFYPSGFVPFVESSTGLGVSHGSAEVFASDHARNQVVIFSPTTALPSVSGVSAPSPGATTATLKGTIAPGDATNSDHFDYGSDTTYANGSSPEATPNAGAAEAGLTGLQPSKVYHYRLVASNARGTTYGADQTFQTSAAAPSIDGESHESVTQADATLSALINPNNLETSYQFKIGTDTGYTLGTVPSPAGTLSSGFGDQEAKLDLNAAGITLAPNTEYHYKVIATNAAGPTVEGEDQTFTTVPLPPKAVTEGASEITQTTATISGDINGQGADTVYYFNYGEHLTYGKLVPEPEGVKLGVEAGRISEDTPEAIPLTGLAPNTTYHYQLVAYNVPCLFFFGALHCELPSNITSGQDRQFTTFALAPVVTADPPAKIESNSATLTGSINPQGVAATYRFEYGTTAAYGTSLPEEAVAATKAGVAVSTDVAGLEPNTTYHYRLVGANNGGATVADSPDETFSTYAAGAPSTAPLPPGFSLTGPPLSGPTAFVFADLSTLSPLPPPPAKPTSPPKTLTNAQKLAKALKSCKKDKSKSRRTKCENEARKKYGPKAKTKK